MSTSIINNPDETTAHIAAYHLKPVPKNIAITAMLRKRKDHHLHLPHK